MKDKRMTRCTLRMRETLWLLMLAKMLIKSEIG